MLYQPMTMEVDGILLFQNQSIGVEHPETGEDVETMPGGAQGYSIGPQRTTISIRNAIPNAGADFDLGIRWQQYATVKVLLRRGDGKKLKGTFVVKTLSTNSETGQAVVEEATLSSIGTPAPVFS